MTTQANMEHPVEGPTTEQIAAYLDQHPRFFDEHPELLAGLNLSHSSGKAVSLIERQVQVLRDQNEALKGRLVELVDVARDNDRLNGRMHEMTLDLLQADSLVELLDTLEDHLRNEFRADAIALRLVQPEEGLRRETDVTALVIDEPTKALFATSLCDGKAQCGRLKQEQLEFLFGDRAAGIASAAVMPLGHHGREGLLAIGSREADRFSPRMGTLFLSHLAELLVPLLGKRPSC
jgi:uncharacterized protein YigA (DUF484 family)